MRWRSSFPTWPWCSCFKVSLPCLNFLWLWENICFKVFRVGSWHASTFLWKTVSIAVVLQATIAVLLWFIHWAMLAGKRVDLRKDFHLIGARAADACQTPLMPFDCSIKNHVSAWGKCKDAAIAGVSSSLLACNGVLQQACSGSALAAFCNFMLSFQKDVWAWN